MNTSNFLDANVWLALIWGRHVHSQKARAWFAETGEEQFFFCRFTQITVLRLLTTESVMGVDLNNMSQAWALWDRIWADDRISFLAEPVGIEEKLRSGTRHASSSPKVWADAYLLAFASVAGLKFVTFDRALKSRGNDVLVL